MHHLTLLLFLKDTLTHNLLMVGLCNQVRLDRVLTNLDPDVIIRANLMVLAGAQSGRVRSATVYTVRTVGISTARADSHAA